ncbi:hypothetical protein ERO13_D01G141448v2, partial [Gossypium hirsutum]
RERVYLLRTSNAKVIAGGVDESPVAEKGHFVIYTADQKRHHVPLSYLSNNIFVELLKLFGGRVWSIKSWSYNVAL